jgi:hypothetical protein
MWKKNSTHNFYSPRIKIYEKLIKGELTYIASTLNTAYPEKKTHETSLIYLSNKNVNMCLKLCLGVLRKKKERLRSGKEGKRGK